MNRPTRIAATLVACLGFAACGGDDDAADDSASTEASVAPGDESLPPGTATDTMPIDTLPIDTLPAADPSTYVGRNRAVNLLVLPDGSTPTVDVWAMRSFQYGPILLAEGLGYGAVSDWYGHPEGMSVIVVESGAGPDADPVASLFSAGADQQYTHLVMFDRSSSAAAGFLLEDVDPGNSNQFPEAAPATGLVQLYSYQLTLHALSEGESFDQTIAGVPTSWNVGIEGVTGCAPQPRLTDQGFSPAVLGGTQRVPFDLEPGTTNFTFHGWGSDNQDCADPTLFGPIPVTVEAGTRQWVVLHSADGESIDALVLPID